MKEQSYSWYPSADDILKRQKAKNTYEEECRYKHHMSRYNSKPGVRTPTPPNHLSLAVSGHKTPMRERPPTAQRRTSRPVSASYSHSVTPQLQCRGPSPAASPFPPGRILTNPQKAWVCHAPDTCRKPQPQTWSNRDSLTTEYNKTAPTFTQRVRSAHVHRPRLSAKHRSIKSAGPSRSTSNQAYTRAVSRPFSAHMNEEQQQLSDATDNEDCEEYHPVKRNNSVEDITEPETTDESDEAQTSNNEDFNTETSPSSIWRLYDNQLKQYGWRMEVPGDPLNLKAPCIVPKLPYSQPCKLGEVLPDGPKATRSTNDTYFYNTIPRRHATFDIAKDWASEAFHAQRMELQKRDGGIKYKFKNYAFVY